MQRFKSTAWVVAYASVWIAAGVGHPIRSATNLETAAVAASLIGFAAGIFWRAAYPRPLAERLMGLAGFWAFVVALTALGSIVSAFGGSIGTFSYSGIDPLGVIAAIGVLAALVLAEVREPSQAQGPASSGSSITADLQEDQNQHVP